MFGAAGCRNIPRCNRGSTSVCQPSRGEKQTRAFFNHIIKSSQPVMLSGAIFCHLSHSRSPPWPNWPLAAVPRWCGHKDAAGRHTCQIPHQDNIHSAAVRTDFWIITDRARLSPRALHASGEVAAERSGFVLCAGELAPSTGA